MVRIKFHNFCILCKKNNLRYNRSDFTVVLGRHDRISDTGVVVPVQEVKIHEDFTSDKLHDTNDIALLKLLRPVKFTDYIQPVCLPNPRK